MLHVRAAPRRHPLPAAQSNACGRHTRPPCRRQMTPPPSSARPCLPSGAPARQAHAASVPAGAQRQLQPGPSACKRGLAVPGHASQTQRGHARAAQQRKPPLFIRWVPRLLPARAARHPGQRRPSPDRPWAPVAGGARALHVRRWAWRARVGGKCPLGGRCAGGGGRRARAQCTAVGVVGSLRVPTPAWQAPGCCAAAAAAAGSSHSCITPGTV